jgi:hypothetical protein
LDFGTPRSGNEFTGLKGSEESSNTATEKDGTAEIGTITEEIGKEG